MFENVLASLLLLEISFAIEILGFNVTDTFGKRALQKDQVCREVLVFINFDDAPDLQLKTF